MIDRFENIRSEANVLILGFGIEGLSTYHYLSEQYPRINLCIADKNSEKANEFQSLFPDTSVNFYSGKS